MCLTSRCPVSLTRLTEETRLVSDETLAVGEFYVVKRRQVVWTSLKGDVRSTGVLVSGDLVMCVTNPCKHPYGITFWVKVLTRFGVGYVAAKNTYGHYDYVETE